jgi:hypothetical protein
VFTWVDRRKRQIFIVIVATLCSVGSPFAVAAPLAQLNASISPPAAGFIVLTQPVKLKIAYGETTLPVGMRLPIVSSDTSSVRVDYMGEEQTIPIASGRFETSGDARQTAATPATTPPPSIQASSPPSAAAQVQISLQPGYDSRMQGGDITMRELQLLLSPYCQEGVDLSGAGTNIYNGVIYLMDSGQAAAALGLGHAIPSRVLVATPGFPRNSTYYIGYDGAFEGRFNRLYLVTDIANKIIAVQLVDEHPNTSSGGGGSSGRSWNTYNFLNASLRASNTMRVHADSKREGNAILIETRIYESVRQRKGRGSVTRYEEKEHTKLFIPIPFARIILHCARAGLSKT